MTGINDVWRQFDAPLQTEWHVSLDEYASFLEHPHGAAATQGIGTHDAGHMILARAILKALKYAC
jgi:hypothetical protein